MKKIKPPEKLYAARAQVSVGLVGGRIWTEWCVYKWTRNGPHRIACGMTERSARKVARLLNEAGD